MWNATLSCILREPQVLLGIKTTIHQFCTYRTVLFSRGGQTGGKVGMWQARGRGARERELSLRQRIPLYCCSSKARNAFVCLAWPLPALSVLHVWGPLLRPLLRPSKSQLHTQTHQLSRNTKFSIQKMQYRNTVAIPARAAFQSAGPSCKPL